MRSTPDEAVVYDAAERLAAGWHDLVLEVADGEALTEPVLCVSFEGEGEASAEYALASAGPGANTVLLEFPSPVERITLIDDGGSDISRALVSARVARVRWSEIIQRALQRAPGDVGRAAMWRARGKKVRASNIMRRVLPVPEPRLYRAWLAAREAGWAREVESLLSSFGQGEIAEGLGVVLLLAGSEAASEASLRSISAQAGGTPKVFIAEGGGGRTCGLQVAFDTANVHWLLFLRNGDELDPAAALRVLTAARRNPGVALIHGDHDRLDGAGRRRAPQLTPQWNEPLFWARNYLGAIAVSREAVRAAGGVRGEHAGLEVDDLVLTIAEHGGRIVRVPRILSHECAASVRHCREVSTARAAMVEAHLQRHEPKARAAPDGRGGVRVTWPLPEPAPLVSLIVPTRDRVDLLRPCIDGLLHRTDYRSLEIIVADNGSTDHATLDFLTQAAADSRVRIVPVPGPFNFAAINNAALRAARGSVVGFMNNDIEVMQSGWLREMVSWALRPDIGAVGAKLLYPTGYVQHAGVIMGLHGTAGYAHRFFPSAHRGYMGRLGSAHCYSAVTAACLLVERAKLDAAGGFDEAAFPVAYNDVDLCLRLARLGYASLYTPYAELIHKESATRAADVSAARQAAYQKEAAGLHARWAAEIADDPCYNPLLTRESEDFSLA